MIDEKTALKRIEPNKLDELLHPVFDKVAEKQAKVWVKGLPASPFRTDSWINDGGEYGAYHVCY